MPRTTVHLACPKSDFEIPCFCDTAFMRREVVDVSLLRGLAVVEARDPLGKNGGEPSSAPIGEIDYPAVAKRPVS